MINHQSAIKEFAMALQEDCCNDLMHLTSEIDVILEHPFCAADDSFHGRLQSLHNSLEGHVEQIYEVGGQLLEHPVLGIDAANIGILKVTSGLLTQSASQKT
jgi:hypothetical protein